MGSLQDSFQVKHPGEVRGAVARGDGCGTGMPHPNQAGHSPAGPLSTWQTPSPLWPAYPSPP